MKKNNQQLSFFSWQIIVFFFLALFLYFQPVVDTDLGWHLAVGRYVWENHAAPQKDLFSFSQPDYPYVYHSWLTELGLFLVNRLWGLWGITFFYSSLAAIGFCLLFLLTRSRLEKTSFAWLILFLVPLTAWIIGQRTQIITFVGLALLYSLLSGNFWQPRNLWKIPLIFLFWANLHGGFILGLSFLGLNVFLEALSLVRKPDQISKNKRKLLFLFSLIFLSVFSCLVTPYGLRSFWQAKMMLSNQFISQVNLDWLPLFSRMTQSMFFGVLLYFFLLLVFSNKNIHPKEKFFSSLFFLFALVSRRFALPFMVIIISPLISVFAFWWGKINLKFSLSTFPLFLALFVFSLSLFGVSLEHLWQTQMAYSSEEFYAKLIPSPFTYPYEAVGFMKENGVPSRLFNDFNWGGYLIWHFPSHRFFADGRMDNFFVNGRPFIENYWQIINLKTGWQEEIKKYQINGFLIARNWPLVAALKLDSQWQVALESEDSILFLPKQGIDKTLNSH